MATLRTVRLRARALAKAEGIKYTEALRRIQEGPICFTDSDVEMPASTLQSDVLAGGPGELVLGKPGVGKANPSRHSIALPDYLAPVAAAVLLNLAVTDRLAFSEEAEAILERNEQIRADLNQWLASRVTRVPRKVDRDTPCYGCGAPSLFGQCEDCGYQPIGVDD